VLKNIVKFLSLLLISMLLVNCGGGGGVASGGVNGANGNSDSTQTDSDEFNRTEYKGLVFYYKNLPPSAYKLEQLSDSEFNSFNEQKKLQIANKLLNTLFWSYHLKDLKEKINSGTFISDIREKLNTPSSDKAWIEEHILNDKYFKQYTKAWQYPQVLTILRRFYSMKHIDNYLLNNWTAYILTQTIMFSPAYELSSSHLPNISRVYNRLVTMLENGSGMRYITYVHMQSEDNWRRFRSPEDNGREMLEIFLQDTDDKHVPLAGKALQNWSLNSDSDTLEVGLNRNTTPIKLFGTTIYTGEDFYRELAKSSAFTKGVTNRLVDFFFPQKSASKRAEIAAKIVSSKPETWQDILLQIIFSKEYLLHNTRALSLEERLYSLYKKLDYRNKRDMFYGVRVYLENTHQASMKYKLGKLERVPLDTLSFAFYHKYIRQEIFARNANASEEDRDKWSYQGWQDSFVDMDNFEYDTTDDVKSLKSFVNYIFESIIARKATASEQKLFKDFMIQQKDGKELFRNEFNIFYTNDDAEYQAKRRLDNRKHIAQSVLDYLSRLEETYMIKESK